MHLVEGHDFPHRDMNAVTRRILTLATLLFLFHAHGTCSAFLLVRPQAKSLRNRSFLSRCEESLRVKVKRKSSKDTQRLRVLHVLQLNNITMDEMRRLRRDRWLHSQRQSQRQRQQNTRIEDGLTSTGEIASSTNTSKSGSTTSTTSGSNSNESKVPHCKDVEEEDEIAVLQVRKPPFILGSDSKQKQIRADSPSASTAFMQKEAIIDLVSSEDEENEEILIQTKYMNRKRPRPRSRSHQPMSSSSSSSTSKIPSTLLSRRTNEHTINLGNNTTGSSSTFTLCTYNIWFGPAHPARRMAQISSLLSQKPPTLIGLQEVTPTLRQDLFPLLESIGYHMICQPNLVMNTDYGLAIGILTTCSSSTSSSNNDDDDDGGGQTAQLVDSGYHPYSDSIMNRGLLWAQVFLNEQCSILFTTTHLESFIPSHSYPLPDKENHNGSKRRVAQICEARDFCLDFVKRWNLDAAFVTGDLNWDDERKRSKGDDDVLLSVLNNNHENEGESSVASSWQDAWMEIQRGEEGYTYDSKKSPMLKGNLRRRFDRILSYFAANKENGQGKKGRGNSSKMKCESSVMIGTEAIDGIVWEKEVPEWKYGKPTGKVNIQNRPVLPSDHFGLSATFRSNY